MSLNYGYVVVTKGVHKGRIGFYDDEASEKRAIVYFGDPLLTTEYVVINKSSLNNSISSNQVKERYDRLTSLLFQAEGNYEAYNLLLEYCLCREIMNERFIKAMYIRPTSPWDCKLFISYSSDDLVFARLLASDLIEVGFDVFLADNSIDIGDNIIADVSNSLGKSIAFIPIISNSYLKSVFCRDEWTAFYISFSKTNPNSIYPIIIDSSNPPAILSSIKYIRLGLNNYEEILESIVRVR